MSMKSNVADDIEVVKDKDMEQLRKYRAENDDAKKKSDNLVSSYVGDIKYSSSRRKPIDQLNKLANDISLVDLYAISKMNKDEKNEIIDNIKIIKQKIKEIESNCDVK